MDEHHNLPDINRLSIIAATILFIYALAPFIDVPGINWAIQLPWAVYYLRFDMSFLISMLVAMITAVGTDWLLRSHPRLGEQNIIQYAILPTLTAWVIRIPLNIMPVNLQWWAVLAFGGVLLILVLISEYIAVDVSDSRHALAAMGLTAVSYALFLFLAISMRGSGLRLYLVLPTMTVTVFLMSLRTLYLRLAGRRCIGWSLGISATVSQIVISLHYLPVSPLAFGLILLGPTYGLLSIAGAYEEGSLRGLVWVEPLMIFIAALIMALATGF